MNSEREEDVEEKLRDLLGDNESIEEFVREWKIVKELEDTIEPSHELFFEQWHIHPLERPRAYYEEVADDEEPGIPNYSGYIGYSDIVSGDINEFHLVYRNEGENEFPGAHAEWTRIKHFTGTSEYTAAFEIPSIQPGESGEARFDIPVVAEGTVTLQIKYTAADGEPMVITPHGDDQDLFEHVFRAIPRERLVVLERLDDIFSQISSQGEVED